MKKKKYEKPSLEVVVLNQKPTLLAGSGLDEPNEYPDGGDPLGF